MEELFCIGCGAQIQTEDKEKAGYTPASSIKKAEETGELYCQRCFRLRHYNEIVDVHITDDEFLKLLHEVGDSDALLLIFSILMDQSFQACHALFLVMMCSWSEIKRISYLNLLKMVR